MNSVFQMPRTVICTDSARPGCSQLVCVDPTSSASFSGIIFVASDTQVMLKRVEGRRSENQGVDGTQEREEGRPQTPSSQFFPEAVSRMWNIWEFLSWEVVGTGASRGACGEVLTTRRCSGPRNPHEKMEREVRFGRLNPPSRWLSNVRFQKRGQTERNAWAEAPLPFAVVPK